LYRLASEVGADADEQVGRALEFGLQELGFESAFVVTLAGDVLMIERKIGAESRVGIDDPVFRQLFLDTIAGAGLLELDEARLKQRSDPSEPGPFCRSFIGVPLDAESGRYGAVGFASRSATPALSDSGREFLRAVAELTAAGIERAVEVKRLESLAHFDSLTGLPNRVLLSYRFKQAIATAQRCGEHVAVYFIDVDKFKVINDTYGHNVGDEVLRTVAKRLLNGCRASDTVARLAGDEFVVLRSGPSIDAQADALAVRLRTELEAPCTIEGLSLTFSVGMGISVFPQHGADEKALLESADVALYAAKACGAGSIRRFGADHPIERPRASSLKNGARRAKTAESLGTGGDGI
jgi:diguanylate cyclase (GGDEF)-like protein